MAGSGLLVGAIDFGTTFSGWAYSFAHEYKSDPTKIRIKYWSSGGTLRTEKAPSCALIRPDGKTLEAFGYDAENKYIALNINGKHKQYYYFRRFKMSLNRKLDEGVNREFTIEDEMGRSLPAKVVFSTVIKYLTTDLMSVVDKGLTNDILKSDIVWVLTVPAIWTDSAKGFMKAAAIEAGIDPQRLVICLEPEAASILCRHLPVSNDQSNISTFSSGTKYLILDAGGGTVDITVHQVTETGGLKEVKAASGGGWGGTTVDVTFMNLIIDIVTPSVYWKFIKTETEDWIDLWRNFEEKKKSIKPDTEDQVTIRFPYTLSKMYMDNNGQSLEDAIKSSKYAVQVTLVVDKLRINADLMRDLFDTAINNTIDHVKTLLREPEVKDIKAILMVGGFSDSPMLQHAVKSAFPRIPVINPSGAATAILQGAVIFGHSPKSISERVLRYTYGIRTRVRFQEGVHPSSKKVDDDWCDDVFSKHAEINQTVPVDKACEKQTYSPVYESQKQVGFYIYASHLKNPQFVDDPGCTKIGRMVVEIPQHKGDCINEVSASMKFGGTEIEVTGRDEVTGKETKVAINFF